MDDFPNLTTHFKNVLEFSHFHYFTRGMVRQDFLSVLVLHNYKQKPIMSANGIAT